MFTGKMDDVLDSICLLHVPGDDRGHLCSMVSTSSFGPWLPQQLTLARSLVFLGKTEWCEECHIFQYSCNDSQGKKHGHIRVDKKRNRLKLIYYIISYPAYQVTGSAAYSAGF